MLLLLAGFMDHVVVIVVRAVMKSNDGRRRVDMVDIATMVVMDLVG